MGSEMCIRDRYYIKYDITLRHGKLWRFENTFLRTYDIFCVEKMNKKYRPAELLSSSGSIQYDMIRYTLRAECRVLYVY